jgi:hypothetical protein
VRFPLDATPTDLTFAQWLGLFTCFRDHVPPHKQQALVARVQAQEPTGAQQRPPILRPPLPRPPPAWIAWCLKESVARTRAVVAGLLPLRLHLAIGWWNRFADALWAVCARQVENLPPPEITGLGCQSPSARHHQQQGLDTLRFDA